MIYFFARGGDALTCETRLSPTGTGYEIAIAESGLTRTEHFADLTQMLSREHELVQAWRAQGWREIGPAARKRKD